MTQPEIGQGLTARSDFNFIEVIEAILREPQSGGFFKHEVMMPNGEKATYQLSFAAGMSSLHAKYHYRRHFGKSPPEWTQFVHPQHAAQVCHLAMDRNADLPVAISTYGNWGGTA